MTWNDNSPKNNVPYLFAVTMKSQLQRKHSTPSSRRVKFCETCAKSPDQVLPELKTRPWIFLRTKQEHMLCPAFYKYAKWGVFTSWWCRCVLLPGLTIQHICLVELTQLTQCSTIIAMEVRRKTVRAYSYCHLKEELPCRRRKCLVLGKLHALAHSYSPLIFPETSWRETLILTIDATSWLSG